MKPLYPTPFIDAFTLQNLKNTRYSLVSFAHPTSGEGYLQEFAYNGKQIFEHTVICNPDNKPTSHIYRERDSNGHLHGTSFIAMQKKNKSGYKKIIAETYACDKLIRREEKNKPHALYAIKREIAEGREFKEDRLQVIPFLLSTGPWQRDDIDDNTGPLPRIGLDIRDAATNDKEALYHASYKLRLHATCDNNMFYATGNHVEMIENMMADAQTLSGHDWQRHDYTEKGIKMPRISAALPEDPQEENRLTKAMERMGLLDVHTHYSLPLQGKAISTAGGASVLFMQELTAMMSNVKALKPAIRPNIIIVHRI